MYNSHTDRHVATKYDNKLLVHVQEGRISGLASETVLKRYEVQRKDMESETRPGMTGIGSEDGMFFLV